MNGSICCMGEMLLRFSPDISSSWVNHPMPFHIGGAELNVATALAKWDQPVEYFTALPDIFLSHHLVNYLKKKNIGTGKIKFSGDRIGIYYLPEGLDVKNDMIAYDRQRSSFASLRTGDVNWEEILRDVSWLHFSAISPALTENTAELCLEALKKASEMGITISVDLNYRSRLWKYGVQPSEIMPGLVAYCDVIMGNLWSAEALLNIPSPVNSSEGYNDQALVDAARESFSRLRQDYPKASALAYTFRLNKKYFAVMETGEGAHRSKDFNTGGALGKVGSGDCFMAGLIHGIRNGYGCQRTVDLAASAAAGKMFENGDTTAQHMDDILDRIHPNTF